MAGWAEPRSPEIVLGGEARGFFLSAALAFRLVVGSFRPAPGKLPLETIAREYELENGKNTLEVEADARPGSTCSSTTTCSRPAARRGRWPSWSSISAVKSSVSLPDRAGVFERPQKRSPAQDVFSLIEY